MSKPIYKVDITPKRFWATVRRKDNGKFSMSVEHLGFGNREQSEHDTQEEAIEACDAYAKQLDHVLNIGSRALLAKYGPNLAVGLGPERALEMVERGEVTL